MKRRNADSLIVASTAGVSRVSATRGLPCLQPAVRLCLAMLLAAATHLPAASQSPASPGVSNGATTVEQALRILVSLQDRTLWLVENGDTLFKAPVAVGRNETFRYGNQVFDWRTPPGERRVLAMRRDPVWSVPDWHYYERAVHEGLKIVELRRGSSYAMADGSSLEVRGEDVVRVLGDQYWIVPRGREIVIDGVLYMPPHGTNQRRVPGVLGTRALDLGEGYLIHGTNPYNRTSVGLAASHGCIRMHTADVEQLFNMVSTGTPVIIF